MTVRDEDIDVGAPSHEFASSVGPAPGALQFCLSGRLVIGGSSAKKKGVCGEHIDARARTCVPV